MVKLPRDVDASNASDFEVAIDEQLGAGPVLDLSPTGYLDSAGFHALERLRE